MKKKTIYFLILVTFFLVFATSCNQKQEESVNTAKTEATNKVVETRIPTTPKTPTIEVTPTATYTPKKAEGFENCETTIYKGCDCQGYTNISVLYENSYLVLEIDGIRTIISESGIINGTTYFTINGVKISVSSGTVLFLYLYTKDTDTGVFSSLRQVRFRR